MASQMMASYKAPSSRSSQKTDDLAWSYPSYIPLPGRIDLDIDLIQAQPAAGSDSDKACDKVPLQKKDELETLRKDREDSLLRIADLERQVQIAEQSVRLKEGAATDIKKLPKKKKAGRKKTKSIDGAHLVARIDDFHRNEEKLTAELKQKEDQRYQATQQVIALREQLSTLQHHIENLKYANKQMEGEMKQLLEIAPEDIPDDVNVRVLIAQLRARVSMLERENQQIKVHTEEQSKQVPIMDQEQKGIEEKKTLRKHLKKKDQDVSYLEENKTLTEQLEKMDKDISYFRGCMEDSKNYEKSIKEMIDTMAAEKKALIDENEQLKSENSDLKTQLETEQATPADVQANIEKSETICQTLKGGLGECQSLISRFQDGLAAFQTDYKLLTKVTEERDRLKSETIHQRKTIATSQDSFEQFRQQSERNFEEVNNRCEQQINQRIQQESQTSRMLKQLNKRMKETALLVPSKKTNELVKRQYSQDVKAFTVKSTTPIQYSDRNRIGRGSFGCVYAVNLNGTPCIAKRLHDILMGRGKQENVTLEEKQACHENLCRECVLMSQAEHPNVVKFIGVQFGKDEFDLMLFMEQLHIDLAVYLSSTSDMPLPSKVSILHDVSCGLLYLHEECSIIHRDLTAANILLTADNRAKIADLGVSRIFTRSLFQLSKIPGTLPYMPPEALQDGAKYDESLDIFSFGVLTLFVGNQMSPDLSWDHVPDDIHAKGEQEIFKRKKWIEMMKPKEPELISLVLWCLSDDPKSRPSTYCVNVILQEMKMTFSNC